MGTRTRPIIILTVLICFWAGESLAAIDSDRSVFKQKLGLLSAETFTTGAHSSVKDDCEFAAAVIRNFSRPSDGLVFVSQCVYQPGLQDYMVRTELLIDRSRARPNRPFTKTISQVLYRQNISAQYAGRVMKELNQKKSNVLIDPKVSGKSVNLETLALVTPSKTAGR